MLDVEQNLPAVTVVLDEDVERVGVVDPAEETGIGRQRNDRVLDDGEVTLEGLRVFLK